VRCILNNGYDLADLATGAHTALYSYDAMVHFDHVVVYRYVIEAHRVLQPGGSALLHTSNYAGNPGGSYHQNPCWRNFMPPGLLIDYARKVGFYVQEHNEISWSGHTKLDALTLIKKS
jgi:cyclopropane fatty-acyl-phospholipid synthase-like methyltransferase